MIVSVLKITLIEIVQILFNHIWVGIQVRLRLYVVSPVIVLPWIRILIVVLSVYTSLSVPDYFFLSFHLLGSDS